MPTLPKGYNRLTALVGKTIAAHHMLQSGNSVLIGVSGGPDSVALLHVLATLATEFCLTLGVAHLNHCLRREESDRDAAFVSALADRLGLPFYYDTADVREYQRGYRLSLEDAARRVRYHFFRKVCDIGGFQKVAVGHHANDNAESILMHVIRGTGPLGLSGIPPVKNGWIIRPLIDVMRSDIIHFLTENGLQYIFDTSNNDVRYLRNKIRHNLIPHLAAGFNPKIIRSLNRLGSITSTEEHWMDDLTDASLNEAVLSVESQHIVLSVPKVAALHLAAQRRVIRKAISTIKGGLKGLTLLHIESILLLLKKESCYGQVDVANGFTVLRRGSELVLGLGAGLKKKYAERPRFNYSIRHPQVVHIKEIGIAVRFSEILVPNFSVLRDTGHHAAFFDINSIKFPLLLRNIESGDRFVPLGMKGTQKIKKFFINNKVPRDQRFMCPVLLSEGRIIWVVGYRIDDRAKASATTRRVLKAEILMPGYRKAHSFDPAPKSFSTQQTES